MPATAGLARRIVRSGAQRFLLWFLLIAAFVFCYLPTLIWLNEKYGLQDSYYSHGYLIPFITGYLIYRKRAELEKIERSSSRSGLWVIVGALLIHVLGVTGDVNFVSAFSVVLYLVGISLFLLGREFTRAIRFPLLFLCFMCPLPTAIIDVVAIPLKSTATGIATVIIDRMGVPHLRDGFIIHFAHSSFVVGTPCNGLRSLISFLALGLLFLYCADTASWKKGLFLAFIPPMAVFLNGVRIAVLLLIAYRFGAQAASTESYLHDASGMAVFLVGLAIMGLFLRRIHEA
ncbi:MAG: exosortase/archaeosortase family protein [bacterium]